jgi:hypothetical protein
MAARIARPFPVGAGTIGVSNRRSARVDPPPLRAPCITKGDDDTFALVRPGGGSMSEQQPSDATSGFDRRTFVKRAAVGAFAIPAVVSFKLDSLARGGGYHSWPNQSEGNQTYPGHSHGNQTYPGHSHGNQTFPGHSYGNQTFPGGDFIDRLIRFLRLFLQK